MNQPPSDQPIPRDFHSEYEERPFHTCSRCGELLEVFENYQINKAYRNGECVFEYVFCGPCRDALLEEFSDESKLNMMRHQEKHLRQTNGIQECAFCGKSQVEAPMRDYVITALCKQESLLDSLMICESCQLGMHELLSEKTRDVRRRFFEDLPGVPPDWEAWQPKEEVFQITQGSEPKKLALPAQASGMMGKVKSELSKVTRGSDEVFRHPADDGCLELLFVIKRLRQAAEVADNV